MTPQDMVVGGECLVCVGAFWEDPLPSGHTVDLVTGNKYSQKFTFYVCSLNLHYQVGGFH